MSDETKDTPETAAPASPENTATVAATPATAPETTAEVAAPEAEAAPAPADAPAPDAAAPATDAAPSDAAAPAPKKERAPKGPKGEKKSAKAAAAAEGDAAAGDAPVERKEITAKDLLSEGLEDIKIRKAKGSKNIVAGVCHVLATFNNTKVTFTDTNGNVISWGSAGRHNFRGSRKSTAYAAQIVCQEAGRVAMSHGLKDVAVKIKGPGMGRDSAIRALQNLGLNVTSILDATPVPHNGCRPPKRRRV
jgi:small subunit ribosomal protein S11